jgi:hypothetical protein
MVGLLASYVIKPISKRVRGSAAGAADLSVTRPHAIPGKRFARLRHTGHGRQEPIGAAHAVVVAESAVRHRRMLLRQPDERQGRDVRGVHPWLAEKPGMDGGTDRYQTMRTAPLTP